MRVYKEVTGADFEFWSGAKQTVEYLTEEEIEQIFDMLEDCNPEGLDETEVNDFFWFDDDTIADYLGWPDFETLMKARSGDEWPDTYDEYLLYTDRDFIDEEDENE